MVAVRFGPDGPPPDAPFGAPIKKALYASEVAMKSPITVLWGNIVHTFENIDEASLQMHIDATSKGVLAKSIAYDDEKSKIRTPFADLESREINLQETYLSHLWAFIYAILVLYEEGIQKPLMNNTFDGNLRFDSPLLRRARELFDWSISLAEMHSDWDENLPNPRTHKNEEERFYAEKVNGLFQSAVAYLMFHEFAHLTQGHESLFLGIPTDKIDATLIAERIQIENEADQFAFNMLVKDNDTNTQRWHKGIPVILVMCSAILITKKPQGLKQKEHPDLDNRLLSVINNLNLGTEESEFYCIYLCIFAIRLYFKKHNIDMAPGDHETINEALTENLNYLDDIKSSYGI